MSSPLLHVAEALSRPLLFHPAKLEVILAALGDRIGLQADRPSPDASRFLGRPRADRSYRVESGVAIISIVGSLANRGAYIGASSGIVSYEGLAEQLRRAAADVSVRGIVLDINSGGGEATGMYRLAAQIREIRKTKRVVAYIDDLAASAAYGIAAQASEIVVSPTSIVGSIGVVLAHIDRSGELEKKGQRVTLIHAGANKVDGHPFGPLSEAVRADLQAEIMAFYDQFVATVAAGRPKLSDAAIRGTEARTFIGQAAIDAGLADRIASLEDVVASLSSSATQRLAPQQRSATTGAAHMAEMSFSSFVDAYEAGADNERNRIVGILTSEEGRSRPSLALELALEGAMSVDTVRSLLARAPIEGAPPEGKYFLGIKPMPSGRKSGLMTLLDEKLAGGTPSASPVGSSPKASNGLMALADEKYGATNAGGASSPAPAEASQPRRNGLMDLVDEEFARASGLPPR